MQWHCGLKYSKSFRMAVQTIGNTQNRKEKRLKGYLSSNLIFFILLVNENIPRANMSEEPLSRGSLDP